MCLSLRANFNHFCQCVFVSSWYLVCLNALHYFFKFPQVIKNSHMTHIKARVLKFLATFCCWFPSFVFYVFEFPFYYAYLFTSVGPISVDHRAVFNIALAFVSTLLPMLTFIQLFRPHSSHVIQHLTKPKLWVRWKYRHLHKTSAFSPNSSLCLMTYLT